MTTQTGAPTTGGTITALDIYAQIADWEGAPPAYLCQYPASHVAELVIEFLDLGHNAPNLTAGLWVSVDIDQLQAIAQQDAEAFNETTGRWPW
jgi:hypothetical protein